MQGKLKSFCIMIIFILVFSITFSISSVNIKAETEPKFIQVSAGSTSSLALKDDGTVWAWGYNKWGQLGDGSNEDKNKPVMIRGLNDVKSISAGNDFGMAVKDDGTVWAWGCNKYGQLGDGANEDKNIPVMIQGLNDVKSISAGNDFCIALKNDGTVWAWGYNGRGQLGDGTNENKNIPVVIQGLDSVKSVSAGWNFCLALRDDGTIWTWGYNNWEQFGHGIINSKVPEKIQELNGATSVSAGYRYGLILKNDKTVWACTYDRLFKIDGLEDINMISAGYNYNMALKNDGTVWTWGKNNYGQLGNGCTQENNNPQQVYGLKNAISVDASMNDDRKETEYNLAVESDGSVWAWGNNSYGQLGNGTNNYKEIPVKAKYIKDIKSISAGRYQSFSLKQDGTLWAWGEWQKLPADISQTGSPLQVKSLDNIKSISAGINNILALKNDGILWILPLTDGKDKEPQIVEGLSNVKSMSEGIWHHLSVKNDGTVWAWGQNYSGQLGDGTNEPNNTPVKVNAITKVAAVAAGFTHSLAIKSDGTVWAWGENCSGQLGDGTYKSENVPVKVQKLQNIKSIAAGGYETITYMPFPVGKNENWSLALQNDGIVWAWGYNEGGQLGDGTYDYRNSPVKVVGLDNIAAISAGYTHSLALKSDGTVWAWGENDFGQLGDGTCESRNLPIQVQGIDDVVAISAGGYHSLALKSDGTVWAWGNDEWGQLGDGGGNKCIPVRVKTDGDESAISVTSITIQKKNITIGANKPYYLLYVIEPEAAANQNVIWKSSDENIASVDNYGRVTGKSKGTATITATTEDGGKASVCEVTVKPVEQIQISKNKLVMKSKAKIKLSAEVSPSDAVNKKIIWSSSDKNVVSVDNKGNVIGIDGGKAIITAKSEENGSICAQCEVTVDVPVSVIKLNKYRISLSTSNMYNTAILKATVLPQNATYRNIKWSSSDESIATIDKDGLVTGKAAGRTVITAATEDGSHAKCTVTVAPVTGMSLSKTKLDMNIGSAAHLNVKILPSNAAVKNVVWSSSDEDKVVVTPSGKIIAVDEGTATVTAVSSDNQNVKASCTINVKPVKNEVKITDITLTNVKTGKIVGIISIGKTGYIKASLTGNGKTPPTNKNLLWTSSDTNIITVDDNGKVTAKKAGKAIVAAKATDKSDIEKCVEIEVVQPVKIITLDDKTLTLAEDSTMEIWAYIYPIDTTIDGIKVEWMNSDKNGKYVQIEDGSTVIDEIDGTLVARKYINTLKKGSATITLKITTKDGKSKSISFKVKVIEYDGPVVVNY